MPTLRNRYLTAEFADDTGMLTGLLPRGGESLIRPAVLGYGAAPGTPAPAGEAWSVVRTQADLRRVVTVLESALLRVTVTAELPEDSPLLRLRVEASGRAARGSGAAAPASLGLLRLFFGDGFVDTFEDEQDLAFDGAELDARRQLPPWRVFFREGRRDGLLVAARSKREMSRLCVFTGGVGISPHSSVNYLSALPRPMPATRGRRFAAEIEIGPWCAADHRKILRRTGLDAPAEVVAPPPRGRPPKRLEGEVIDLIAAAPRSAVARGYHPKKWMVAPMPWARRGRVLMANANVRAPALTVRPRAVGPHRVFVGVGNGGGVIARFSDDPELRVRFSPTGPGREASPGPFGSRLAGRQRAYEIDLGVTDLTGQTLRLAPINGSGAVTVLDYVRLVPLSPAQAAAWKRRSQTPPRVELSGFADTPDLSVLTDPLDPDVSVYRANVWEHARCGFRRVHWRIDGQCSDYPSRVNTMRYPSARVHNAFCPHSKAYGRALRKTDMLRLAVDAAKEYGVQLWGWMRFNSYMGNVQSDFFKQNPQWHEHADNGRPIRKLCLAFPEVRRHKIAILVEAASYGLSGLQLGFLRHPPVLHHHPVLTEGFEKEYGKPAPRHPGGDITHLKSLPPDDGVSRAWHAYRALYLTLFGRELRESLRAAELGHLPVSVWVRPNHCLFDGIDLPAWLDEGLCQEVVVNGVIGPDFEDEAVCGVKREWREMVRAKAKLVRCVSFAHGEAKFVRNLPRVAAEGYDGVCTYESNYAVLDPQCIAAYEALRVAPTPTGSDRRNPTRR